MTQPALHTYEILAILSRPVALPDTLAGTSERISVLEDALTGLEHGTTEFWQATGEANALRVHAISLRALAAR